MEHFQESDGDHSDIVCYIGIDASDTVIPPLYR